MKHCKGCHSSLYPEAQFCHNCGKQTDSVKIICRECNNINPEASRFCYRCGSPVDITYSPNPNISPVFGLDFTDIQTVPQQIIEAFRLSLSLAMEYENCQHKEALYLDAYKESNFVQSYLEEASIQMTQEFEELFDERGKSAFGIIEKRVDQQFARLFECFYINYCNNIIPFSLPQKILNYQGINIRSNNLGMMISDYLDVDVKLTYYTKAIEIPLEILKNSRTTFFKAPAGETPLYMADQSLLLNGKEGFILTNKAVYWKSCFHKSAFFSYKKIDNIHYFSDRIELNGIYMNVSPEFNYRLYRLLVRLKTMSYL